VYNFTLQCNEKGYKLSLSNVIGQKQFLLLCHILSNKYMSAVVGKPGGLNSRCRLFQEPGKIFWKQCEKDDISNGLHRW